MAQTDSLENMKVSVLNSLNEQETQMNGWLNEGMKQKDKLKILKRQKRRKQRKNRSTKEKFVFSSEITSENDVQIDWEEPKFEEEAGYLDEEWKGQFQEIFQRFYQRQDSIEIDEEQYLEQNENFSGEQEQGLNKDVEVVQGVDSSQQDFSMGQPKLTKKERKKLINLKVAKLKQQVADPEVVEQWDVTAADPKLLVYLKSYRNAVSVPSHWRQKRKYLQNKRGIEKPPFQLPPFIAQTGIQKLRDAYKAVEDEKTMKQKQREKVRPKLGKVDIDYQVLHDAFFKFQTKPRLTNPGDLYYEFKEVEPDRAGFKPGILSDQLREALGMTSSIVPPPWLINMQRYGPPPSYPRLRIPGLNAPIPPGASFGYQPGGWGKPPVDEYGRPLYGDVFGDGNISEYAPGYGTEEIYVPPEAHTYHWGELEPIEAEEMEDGEQQQNGEEEEEMDENAAEMYDMPYNNSQSREEEYASGMESSSSFLPGGVATPATTVELRKSSQLPSDYQNANSASKHLYQVVPEKKAEIGNSIMATSFVYDIPKDSQLNATGSSEVQVSISPDDLQKWNREKAKEKYEQAKMDKKQQAEYQKGEDVSDIVAEGLAKQNRELERRKRKD
ncbi:Splicing factor 3B subunit 2 [Galdieria sulphuraria]|nr:Splicing factor 3B subunit 2 [Galdieria sulphuraria]